MAAVSDTVLLQNNDNNVVNQTAPESIGTAELGTNDIRPIIESKWSRVDDLLTLPAKDVTKAELATAIGASSLNDRTNGFSVNQVLKIKDRTDGFPLYVQITGVNTISPFGVWVKSSKPLAVIMDYVGGYQGETNPFIAIFDENSNFSVVTPLIIADGTQINGGVLTSDANGKTSWQRANYWQGAAVSPALLAGGGTPLMAGFGGTAYPQKSGRVLIMVSGEFVSNDTATNTNLFIRTGTGTAPVNGDAAIGTIQALVSRLASSATLRIPFSFQVIAVLTPGVSYWVDMAAGNNGAGNVQLFGVIISTMEQ